MGQSIGQCGSRDNSAESPPQVDRCLIFPDITATIGQTPIVRINNLAPEHVNLFVKLEYFNPLGSSKDRFALGVIEAAERSGTLEAGGTVVEATSGNTGVALAMVCAQRGYRFVCVMPDTLPHNRRYLMRMLGAKVLITPARLGGAGMVRKAEELAKAHGWHFVRQFESEAGAEAHYESTGPEIVAAFQRDCRSLDYWVTGYGTGCTFVGAGQAIKTLSPNTKIILAEPKVAPLISSGNAQPAPRSERPENMPGGEETSPGPDQGAHPAWRPHNIFGWTPNFISKVCEHGLSLGLHDDVVVVDGMDCVNMSKKLASLEGIFCGYSGGAAVCAALEVCKSAPQGSNIVAMVTDTAERYLDSSLFEEFERDEMSREELMLFESTPYAKTERSSENK